MRQYCKTCEEGGSHVFEHGLMGYKYHRCRCAVCRDALQAYNHYQYQRHREERVQYRRDYRAANLEAIEAQKRAHHEANRAVILEQRRDHYRRNREAVIEQNRAYQEANRPVVLERLRDYRRRNRDYLNNLGRAQRKRYASIPAPNNGQRWTPEQDAVVMRDDITVVEMCYLLGRSYASVCARRKLRRGGAA